MRNLLVLGPKTIPLRVRWPLGTNAGMLACCHFLALAQAMVLPSVAQGFLSRPPSAYRFEPGDRLVYELRSESTPLTPGAAGERCFGQIEIWCLALKNGEALLLLDFIRIVDNRAEPMRDLQQLELGRHGIIVGRGRNRGLFLPQVATEYGFSREEFLSRCCSEKAGLPADAWRDPRTEVFIFTTDVFAELS